MNRKRFLFNAIFFLFALLFFTDYVYANTCWYQGGEESQLRTDLESTEHVTLEKNDSSSWRNLIVDVNGATSTTWLDNYIFSVMDEGKINISNLSYSDISTGTNEKGYFNGYYTFKFYCWNGGSGNNHYKYYQSIGRVKKDTSGDKSIISYYIDTNGLTPYIILPTVSKTGYTHNGWDIIYDSSSAVYIKRLNTIKTFTNNKSRSVAKLKDGYQYLYMGAYTNYDTIKAKWSANTYTIVYNGNGATGGSTANSSHTYDTTKTLTVNGFTKNGYTFKGWNTKADGTGTAYYNNQGVLNLTTTNGGTVTLYAQWDDGSAPTASIKVTPNTWAYEPEITVEGTDSGSGVSKIEIYRVNDNEDVLVQTDTFSSSSRGSSKTSHTYEGIYEYYGIVYDAEGNSTRTHNVTVYVDRTKPVISLVNIPNEWENKGSFVISADISDALSGIKEQKILLNGEEISNEYTVTADGEYTLVITAMDYAGNTQEYNCTFALDSVGPVISSNVPEGWTNKECFVLHVDVTDALAGVKDYAIYYNEVEQPNNVSITADGQHPYTVWAVDYAGNVTVVSYVLKLDHTPPTFTDKYSHLPEANIKYEASDVTSGLASFKVYDKYGVERDDDSKIPGYINYNGFSTGLDAFYLEAIDNAGNVARLDLKTEETFKVVAEIVDGGYEYKGDILGYLPDTEVTLDIHTYGYVEYVEVVFEKKLSDAAISQGYEIDRTAEKSNHFVYQIPVKKDDSFQYTFKIPQLPKITDAKERKEEIYDIKVTAYRAGIGRSKKLELPVCNMLYIKKRKLGYYKTIIIYN